MVPGAHMNPGSLIAPKQVAGRINEILAVSVLFRGLLFQLVRPNHLMARYDSIAAVRERLQAFLLEELQELSPRF